MVSRPSSAVFPRNLAFTLVLCLFGAAAVFLLHSVNAETASAQTQQCVSLADPRDIPAPRILTFDDLKAGALINDQYVPNYGVSFPGGRNVPTIFEPPAGEAASNPDVLRNEPPVGATSSGIPLEMDFSFPRKYVGMYLGDGLLPAGGSVTATLTAYNGQMQLLCSFVINGIQSAHNTFAGVYDSQGRIARLMVDYGKDLNPESIDNLFLSPGLNPQPRAPQPRWTAIPQPSPTPGPAPTATPQVPAYALLHSIPVASFPTINKPDFSIFNIEVSQGIQCFNGLPAGCADNSLPMVLSKDTVARVYVRANNAAAATYTHVPVRLYILAFNHIYPVDGSANPTNSLNQGAHDSADFYFDAYSGSSAQVQVYAVVDPDNLYSETNEGNNRFPAAGNINMNFNPARSFTVSGERLYYHPGGYSGPNYAGGWAVNGGAATWWNQILPVANNAVHYVVNSGYLDWTANLSSGDNQHALISTLNLMWIQQNALAWWFGTGGLTGARHVYGWAPAAGYSGGHADMPIYPHAGGLGVVGIGSDAPGTSTDSPGSGALIFGHELTHDYNVFHTNTPDACGSNDSNTDFPYANSSIQSFGINTLTGKIYDPSLTHDLMSYCPSGGSKQGWISPFTWNKMDLDLATLAAAPGAQTLQPAAAAPLTFVTTAATQALVVNATLYNPADNPSVLGKLDTLQRVDAGVAYGLPPGTAYTVELRDSGGGLLGSEEFNMNFDSEYATTRSPIPPPPFPADPNTGSQVAFIMPWIDGTRTIRLLYNLGAAPVLIDTRSVPLNAPQVQFTAPLANAAWPAHTLQPLTWNGTDLDGLPLTYTLLYSYDAGANWTLLASGLSVSSYNVDVDSMAGGADVRFRVVASDGVNTGFDETPANISIPNHAPNAIILSPSGAGIHVPGDLIVFHGSGFDMEDGTLPDAALVWSDSLQGGLGIGPSVPINNLTIGKHTVTLTVTDSYDVSSTATVNVLVGYPTYISITRK